MSLAVAPGEVVAVVGASGCGKSTLGRVVVGLKAPSRGRVAVEGRPQLVFQDPYASLNPAHTVRHHLERPAVLAGRRPDPEDALRRVGLDPAEVLHRRPRELSGGQRQRVAIARALAAGPRALVADEPTSMLDPSLRAGVLDVLRGLAADGVAILLITHDLAAAAWAAGRVVVLDAGEVVEEGRTEDVARAPRHPAARALWEA